MDKEKIERFILKHEAGVEFQGMVVYKITKADGKIEIKDCKGKEIKDKNILDNFETLATPYGSFSIKGPSSGRVFSV